MDHNDIRKSIADQQQLLGVLKRQLQLHDQAGKLLRDQMIHAQVALAFLGGLDGEDRGSAADPDAARHPSRAAIALIAAQQRSPARRMMIEELERAGSEGMSASDLNALVMGASMSKDTAEKSKAALKKMGILSHDSKALRWYAPGYGPVKIEAERRLRAKAHAKSSDTG